jgi:DNA invertase Pin-like site-specific DNA recombinase
LGWEVSAIERDFSKAVAYCRTSSAANVEGDSQERQLQAISSYAQRAGVAVVESVYDAAVSGADHVESRPGFARMLTMLKSSDIGVVLVEDASRFARDLMVQEQGLLALSAMGVKLITSSDDDLTESNDPSRIMVRQILGAVAQAEKARVVAKLKHGRDRMRAIAGRCEGRKPQSQEAIAMARELRQRDPSLSLRGIGKRLAEAGILSPSGRVLDHSSVRCLLG